MSRSFITVSRTASDVLHHFRGDTARKLIAEKGHALAKHLLVHPPASDHRQIAQQGLVNNCRGQKDTQREPQQHDENRLRPIVILPG